MKLRTRGLPGPGGSGIAAVVVGTSGLTFRPVEVEAVVVCAEVPPGLVAVEPVEPDTALVPGFA
ncbi:MAG: hypothetical protein ACXVRE_09965, partial [Gaiellaceae bacterium]